MFNYRNIYKINNKLFYKYMFYIYIYKCLKINTK